MRYPTQFLIAASVLTGVMPFTTVTLAAQDSTANVAVKKLAPAEGRSTRGLMAVSSLRALPNGSVFVNDNQRRQLLLFDGTLKDVRVIADTAAGAPLPYGQRPFGLIPYLGDSTIVVDPSTSAMLILNAEGRVARIMASPRTNDLNMLSNVNLGSNAFDTKGQLVYRQGQFGGGPGLSQMFGSGNDRGGRGGGPSGQGAQSTQGRQGAQAGQAGRAGDAGARGGDARGADARGGDGRGGDGRGGDARGGDAGGGFGGSGGFGGGGFGGGPGGRGNQQQNQPDSIPIVRVNFDTRKADSVAWVKVPKNETSMTRGEDGSMRFTSKINPLPQGDDWALLNDGTIAIIRVLDYHVDYYATNGEHVSSGRLPFDWKRISDEDKTKMVDSLKTMAKVVADRASAQGGNNAFRMNFEVIAAEKLPDYYPPIRAGSTQADHDGNLWILPSTSNLAAQLAQSMMDGGRGGGGRGGFGGGGGGPPGGGRAPGDSAARGATRGGGAGGDSTARAAGRGGRAAGDTTGRGGAGGLGGLMPAGVTAAMMAPLVYDVVNRKGELVYRVQLPPGRQIVGFGPNGAVYLTVREGREVFLEKTHVVN